MIRGSLVRRTFFFALSWSTTQRLLALYGVVFVGLLAAWTLYAAFGQSVIEAAYRGESLPIFNGMIAGRGEHPLSVYLALAAQVMRALTGLALVLTAETSGTSRKPVLFLSSLGFVMLLVTARW